MRSSNVVMTKMLLSERAKIDRSPNFMHELRADNKEQIECLKLLLKAGADLNATDEEENTPLIKAVVRGNEGIIKILLKEKPDINVHNMFGETALYKAVMLGHAESERKHSMEEFAYIREDNFSSTYETIVYELLQAGATLEDTSLDHNPCTAHLTPNQFSKPSRHILEMLLAAGANTVETEMIKSDQSLQNLVRGCIRTNLKQIHPESNLYFTIPHLGLPPMLQSYLLFYTLQNTTANLSTEEKEFLVKTSEGDIESVLNFIQNGVNLNVQNEKGFTALMIASEAGHLELTEELIKARANLNTQSLLGNTALIHAITENRTDCVMKLLEAGAKCDIQGSNGETALIKALRHKRKDCFEALLDLGADPNVLSNTNVTALMFAVVSKMFDCAERLIRAGADVNRAPAIFLAMGNEKLFKTLIEAGADLNSREVRSGMTPLVASVEAEQVTFTEQLIQAGADLNISDKMGMTALIKAALLPKSAWFNTLFKAGAEVDTNFLGCFENVKGNQKLIDFSIFRKNEICIHIFYALHA